MIIKKNVKIILERVNENGVEPLLKFLGIGIASWDEDASKKNDEMSRVNVIPYWKVIRMKKLLLGAAVSLMTMASALADVPIEIKQINAEMLSPVVQLNRNCSASVIKSEKNETSGKVQTIILTAKHCLRDTKRYQEVYVPVYNGQNRIIREELYRAVHLRNHASHDISVLELMDTETVFQTVALADSNVTLYEGEPTWVVGWPLGEVRTITTGTFGNRTYMDFPGTKVQTEFYRASTQIAGGNSGGALFHKTLTGQYELIGVTSAYYPNSDFMAYFVPIDTIHDLVRQYMPAKVEEASPKEKLD